MVAYRSYQNYLISFSQPDGNFVSLSPSNIVISQQISTHVPASNGNITTTTHVPQAAPAFRIAPVSSQLINAAKRVRDPRLRKIELQQIRPPNNNSSVTKEAKTSTSSQIDAKIDQKNGLYIALFRVNIFPQMLSNVRNIIVFYKYKILSTVELMINLPGIAHDKCSVDLRLRSVLVSTL